MDQSPDSDGQATGRTRLSKAMSTLALILGVLALAAVFAAVAVAEYIPGQEHLVVPAVSAVIVLWMAATTAWITSVTRPAPTVEDRRALLDSRIQKLTAERAALGEAPPAAVEMPADHHHNDHIPSVRRPSPTPVPLADDDMAALMVAAAAGPVGFTDDDLARIDAIDVDALVGAVAGDK